MPKTRNARLDAVRNEAGATSIEYALIASLISVFIVAAVTLVGVQVTALYDVIADAMP